MREGSEPGGPDEVVDARPHSPAEPDPPAPDDGTAPDEDGEPLFIVAAVQPPLPAVDPAPPDQPQTEPELRPEPERPPPRPEPPPTLVVGPEPELEPQPEAAARRRRFWRPGCFTILLLLVVGLVAGGVYAYQTRAITPRLVLEAVGFGAAEVELVNLRDDAVRVDLATSDVEDVVPASFRLGSLEIRTHRAPRPTYLRIALTAADGTSLGTCALDLQSGDRLQVVVLPEETLIRSDETVPASGRDLLMTESSLCR